MSIDQNQSRDGPAPGYVCFGRGGQVYLVHRVRAWPGFDQVLSVRLVPGTMRTLAGHPLGDDVAAIRLDPAQPAETGCADIAEARLTAGQVAAVTFPLTPSPSFFPGFTVQVEVERELYLHLHEGDQK